MYARKGAHPVDGRPFSHLCELSYFSFYLWAALLKPVRVPRYARLNISKLSVQVPGLPD